ncbi:MAG: hypothetical protein U0641_03420 [Anaerolineae bacterium]
MNAAPPAGIVRLIWSTTATTDGSPLPSWSGAQEQARRGRRGGGRRGRATPWRRGRRAEVVHQEEAAPDETVAGAVRGAHPQREARVVRRAARGRRRSVLFTSSLAGPRRAAVHADITAATPLVVSL